MTPIDSTLVKRGPSVLKGRGEVVYDSWSDLMDEEMLDEEDRDPFKDGMPPFLSLLSSLQADCSLFSL